MRPDAAEFIPKTLCALPKKFLEADKVEEAVEVNLSPEASADLLRMWFPDYNLAALQELYTSSNNVSCCIMHHARVT
jgi:hypothetical protein